METWYRQQEFFSEDKLQKLLLWLTEEYKKYIEDKPPYKVKRRRINNEDGTYYLIHELWTVDEKRNLKECIIVGDSKKKVEEIFKKQT
ncbi:MAG: hypothetical protein PHT02_00575 [Tissierellia bacterium]|nr:hypothetical protein [Tissierellia bacterium]